MLLIDLLPEDRRAVERTPLPRLLTVIGGVLVCGVELAVIAFLFVVTIPAARTARDVEESKLPGLDTRRKRIEELTTELAEFKRRKATIMKIYGERIRWAQKLDVISNPAVLPDRIWLSSLDIEEQRSGTARDKYLVIRGWAQGENSKVRIDAISKFAKRLESKEEFLEDFEGDLSRDLRFEYVKLNPPKEAPEGAPTEALLFRMQTRFKPQAPTKRGRN